MLETGQKTNKKFTVLPLPCVVLQVHFSNNSAFIQGDDIFIYSLQGCSKLRVQKDRVLDLQEVSHSADWWHDIPFTSTVANYLKFDGADISCVKVLGHVSWMLIDCKEFTLRRLYE